MMRTLFFNPDFLLSFCCCRDSKWKERANESSNWAVTSLLALFILFFSFSNDLHAQKTENGNAALPASGQVNVVRGNHSFINNPSLTVVSKPCVENECEIIGSSALCPGSSQNVFSGPDGDYTYSWSISGVGSSIVGPTNQQNVLVNAAQSCNSSFTLTLN
ncbi:MAG: hypothetical protein ACK4UK_00060, partial [Flavobacterium sp.]